jgi:hypothetical protein
MTRAMWQSFQTEFLVVPDFRAADMAFCLSLLVHGSCTRTESRQRHMVWG